MTSHAEMLAADTFSREDRRIVAAAALMRFNHLHRESPTLSNIDRFDYALSIWDDYITDHHHDEITVTREELGEQVRVFANLFPYMPAHELMGLARHAWGDNPVEVTAVEIQFCWTPVNRAAPLMLLTREDGTSHCWVITQSGKHHSVTNLPQGAPAEARTVDAVTALLGSIR